MKTPEGLRKIAVINLSKGQTIAFYHLTDGPNREEVFRRVYALCMEAMQRKLDLSR
ncbi:hypothetical protein [Sulfoacidibacillus thermotolerans]|uniref:hypothetical protein n=1 Tax=Sulfoacidibacillus thermotolerans TaxID=1765684 RepID=UPI0015E81BE1|nr:hypothetical protein [Sulfoacidibacillus thermotolerans]